MKKRYWMNHFNGLLSLNHQCFDVFWIHWFIQIGEILRLFFSFERMICLIFLISYIWDNDKDKYEYDSNSVITIINMNDNMRSKIDIWVSEDDVKSEYQKWNSDKIIKLLQFKKFQEQQVLIHEIWRETNIWNSEQ
jgi:hypothetical protein